MATEAVAAPAADTTSPFDVPSTSIATSPASTAPGSEAAAPAPAPAEVKKPSEPEVNKLFRMVMKYEGSDLHLKVGQPPMMRLRGVIRRMEMRPLTQEDMERLFFPVMKEHYLKILRDTGGADFAYIIGDDECRFRVNLFYQRGKLSCVARRVSNKIPSFEKLGLVIPDHDKIRKPGEPSVFERLCMLDQGLILLAGVTGSGKSTTIAAMLDYINEREPVNIVTLEDPIEYVFTDKKAIIHQREIGLDVINWQVGLKHVVREDPDVILVGEMRDRDTFEAAINAAETGHLVFGTIHASSGPSTIGRILDLFPADMHHAIRQAMVFNLKAVICQKLLPALKPGKGRVPALEVMLVNPIIKELMIKEEDKKIADAIRICAQEGMVDFNDHLRQLVENGEIDRAVALEVAPNPEALKMALKGIKVMQAGFVS
jgi:twitching motility protein PilT